MATAVADAGVMVRGGTDLAVLDNMSAFSKSSRTSGWLGEFALNSI